MTNNIEHCTETQISTDEEFEAILKTYSDTDEDVFVSIVWRDEKGLKQGAAREYSLKTRRLTVKENYKNDKLDGLSELFDTNTGNCIFRANYKDGNYHGLSEDFDSETGNCIYRASHKDGKLDGLVEMLDAKTGRITTIGLFKNDVPVADLTETYELVAAFAENADKVFPLTPSSTPEEIAKHDDLCQQVLKAAGFELS